ncbi:MAG TPA: methyltransferase domain-containing protein [Acidimicrobiales bacterium]|nr:methyltransferase domain-containing protein [Acidimicrobiales bacterium]
MRAGSLERMEGFPHKGDVYRGALVTAFARISVGPGWRCADVGCGTGESTMALAALVGASGRVYAVDHAATACEVVAMSAVEVGTSQVVALVQAAEDLALPESVDLAFCRFLLMHVVEPLGVLRRMAAATRPGGYVIAQEPITTAGRVGGVPISMPDARQPDIGALLPRLAVECGCTLVAAWAEAPADAGPGPVASYLEELSGVDPGDDPIVLPVLVTVIARKRTPS